MQTVAGSAPASRQAAARTALLHCREQQPGHTFTADRVTQQQQARSRNNSVVGINPFSLMSFLANFGQTFKNTKYTSKDSKKALNCCKRRLECELCSSKKVWLEKPRLLFMRPMNESGLTLCPVPGKSVGQGGGPPPGCCRDSLTSSSLQCHHHARVSTR